MSQELQKNSIFKVIGASSLGTLIEWYDFYIFGSLASIIGAQLFPADAGASALINTLAIFAAGFIVRPFGALVFGRLGDLIGRKYTFLLTLVLMGRFYLFNWPYSFLFQYRLCSAHPGADLTSGTGIGPWRRVWWSRNLCG
jgi:MFS family permease